MEKKHTGKIIGLMVLMFVSSYGSNIETLLQANVEYDKAGGYALLYSVIGLCGSALIAMIIPLACRLIMGKKLSHKWGKLLCVVNSIIALVISAILQEVFDILFVGGIGAIIYYFINKWLFVAGKEEQTDKESTVKAHANGTAQMSLSFPDEKHIQYGNYATRSEDIRLDQSSAPIQATNSIPTSPPTTVATPSAVPPQKNVKYCSLCGSRIDSNTKKCTGCGKQYFKGISWTVVLFILVIILAIALVFVITTSNNENSSNQDLPQKENSTVQTVPSTPKATTPPPTEPYYKRLGLTLNEYKIASIVSYDAYEYCEYMAELKEIVEKGTYSDELKQERVIDSINNNDYFEYGEKIILYRFLFPYDNEYNNDIVDYLNERDDVSYEEMEFVLLELGFAVFEDGTVKWD